MTLPELEKAAATALSRGQLRNAHDHCLAILRLAPEHSDARYWLGINCLSRQRPAEAAEALREATALKPSDGRYWAQLARAYSLLDKPQAAREAVSAAIEAAPADPLAEDTIGVVLSRLGDHVRAEPFFRAGLARQPNNPELRFNLLTSLRFNGKLSEAREHSLTLFHQHAERHDVYPLVAELCHEDELGELLEAFEARRPDVNGDVDAALSLAHGTARLLERSGQARAAFESLLPAKRAKRAGVDYDPAAVDRAIDALMAGPVPHAVEGCDAPIFIVGLPRSGTTLLERIIAAHTDVNAGGELQDLPALVMRFAGTPGPNPADEATAAATAAIDPVALGRAYRERTAHLLEEHPRFTDKLPLNVFYSGMILRAMPGARVLCLRRNPMDSVVSNFRQLFATRARQFHYNYDLADTARYYLAFDRLVTHWQRVLPPEAFLQVQYEALVDDAEPVLRRVLDFLSLEWQPQCLRFFEDAAPVATASAVQVRKPLYTSSVQRWRELEGLLKPAVEVFDAAGLPFR